MKIAVIGAGYVGLVTGTCFAEMGNSVVCIDIDKEKVKKMEKGSMPIYEPGLEDIFQRNIKEGRLSFSHDINDVKKSGVVFLALPTPPGENGSADLSYVLAVAEQLGSILNNYAVIVDKSTVPVGTAKLVSSYVGKNSKKKFDVVSNPEFLREGQAVEDFLRPERIVLGTSSPRAEKIMRKLYEPFVKRDPGKIIVTDEASAEMIKYAANGFLATKISYINQIANLCEKVGADINSVRMGIGSDSRIGSQFLYAGPGYGGSCFPKDTQALAHIASNSGYDFTIIKSVIEANNRQKEVITHKVLDYFHNNIKGRNFALWGLAFKDNTDDVRESPAITIAKSILKNGGSVAAFDPQANETAKKQFSKKDKIKFSDNMYSVLEDVDALVIATNWREFSEPNFKKMRSAMRGDVIFDGRNLYSLDTVAKEKFNYVSIGRRALLNA